MHDRLATIGNGQRILITSGKGTYTHSKIIYSCSLIVCDAYHSLFIWLRFHVFWYYSSSKHGGSTWRRPKRSSGRGCQTKWCQMRRTVTRRGSSSWRHQSGDVLSWRCWWKSETSVRNAQSLVGGWNHGCHVLQQRGSHRNTPRRSTSLSLRARVPTRRNRNQRNVVKILRLIDHHKELETMNCMALQICVWNKSRSWLGRIVMLLK